MVDQAYVEQVESWRQAYSQKLLSPDGWLSVSGLFWFQEGENQMGSDAENRIQLPVEGGVPFAGTFTMRERVISLQAAEGVHMTINDVPVTSTRITIHSNGSSDWILLNELKISVIERGARIGVRIFDKNNPTLKQFLNLRWYPIHQSYRIEAKFIAHEKFEFVSIVNVLGDMLQLQSAGYAEFTLEGKTQRLHAIPGEEIGAVGLLFVFLDGTSGDTTYPAGRFLVADFPKEGKIVLDFNRAHNPYCAYTDFVICPLAPPFNRVTVPVKAGELKFPRPVNVT
jgi:uncharacterized protein